MHTYTSRLIKTFKVSHRHLFYSFSWGGKLIWNHKLPSVISHIHAGVRYGSLTPDKFKVVAGRDRCGCVAMLKFQVSRIPMSIRPFFFREGYHCNKRNGFSTVQFSGGLGSPNLEQSQRGHDIVIQTKAAYSTRQCQSQPLRKSKFT